MRLMEMLHSLQLRWHVVSVQEPLLVLSRMERYPLTLLALTQQQTELRTAPLTSSTPFHAIVSPNP